MTHLGYPHRDGETFVYARDGKRLAAQHERVLSLMLDSKWRTLRQIAQETGDPEASVSARLRDLRKPQFGGYAVERHSLGGGRWEYRIKFGQLGLM